MDSFYGKKMVFGCRKLTSNFYTPNKLTGLAGISTMNEDAFPIEKWRIFQCHSSVFRGVYSTFFQFHEAISLQQVRQKFQVLKSTLQPGTTGEALRDPPSKFFCVQCLPCERVPNGTNRSWWVIPMVHYRRVSHPETRMLVRHYQRDGLHFCGFREPELKTSLATVTVYASIPRYSSYLL